MVIKRKEWNLARRKKKRVPINIYSKKSLVVILDARKTQDTSWRKKKLPF
jgi:hypothetical protein